jgi:hypothetical protein
MPIATTDTAARTLTMRMIHPTPTGAEPNK